MTPTPVITIALTMLISTSAHAQSWGPWSVNNDAPAILTEADREPSSQHQGQNGYSVAATPFIWLLKMYRNVISPLDGNRCPMYPTCSQYSIQAIHTHGPIIGIIMTADRLIHEADERHFTTLIKVGNRYRFSDPLEHNDFWWYRK